MASGLPLFRVAGIRVRAHWSVVMIAVLIAWGLAEGVIPATAAPSTLRWGMGTAAAVLLVLSLAVHELAHGVVSRRHGVPVDSITLWLFGGASHLRDDLPDASTELRVAVAGPVATLLTAAVFFGAMELLSAIGAPALSVLTAQWLFGANLILLLFNLAPAHPLDGSRILRAVLWRFRGDKAAASRGATRAGRATAFLLMGLGAADLVLTADLGGIWLVVIGWFLDTTARREQQSESIRGLLHGVRVADAMSREPVFIPEWITVQLLLDQYVVRSNLTTFVTRGLDGKLTGLITLHAVRRVTPNQRSIKRASDIAVPLPAVPSASPDDMLTELLARMSPVTEGRALVFDHGALVGVVSPSEVAKVVSAMRPPPALGRVPPPPPLPPAPETPARPR